MDTELILCGIDGTGFMTGSSLGPLALWQLGLEDAVRAQSSLRGIQLFGPHTIGGSHLEELVREACLNNPVLMRKNPSWNAKKPYPPGSGLTIFEAFDWIRTAVDKVLVKGRTPVICHGDHTFSAASVGRGVAKIPGLNVLWVDAHADFNTPDTSPSGNIHGMPAAMLIHETIPTRASFGPLSRLLPETCLDPIALHYWGVRDLDPAERKILSAHPGFVATMSDVDRYGTTAQVDALLARIPHGGPLWISFDIDSVDPLWAPATGTPVPEGLTKREAFTLAEILSEHASQGRIRIAGVEVVEVNPLRDKARSCDFAVAWIASILGKTILTSKGRG